MGFSWVGISIDGWGDKRVPCKAKEKSVVAGMRIRGMCIPIGVIGIVLGVVFFIFGGDDPFYVWFSGFSIGSGMLQTVVMLRLWVLE